MFLKKYIKYGSIFKIIMILVVTAFALCNFIIILKALKIVDSGFFDSIEIGLFALFLFVIFFLDKFENLFSLKVEPEYESLVGRIAQLLFFFESEESDWIKCSGICRKENNPEKYTLVYKVRYKFENLNKKQVNINKLQELLAFLCIDIEAKKQLVLDYKSNNELESSERLVQNICKYIKTYYGLDVTIIMDSYLEQCRQEAKSFIKKNRKEISYICQIYDKKALKISNEEFFLYRVMYKRLYK